ncbi:MAG: MFS transporter [Candidatus Lokiarchaeota archaeon]|nr:MFS transporter [Candidatus Lokiarchaeota archaeon]
MSELKEFTQEELGESSLELEGKELSVNLNTWRGNIWKSYLIHFIEGFHLISGILLPFFLTWGKLTFVEVMFLQSFFTVMILVFEIPCGAIADYISRKFSLLLGAFSTAFAALVYGSYPNIFIFAIGETLWAFGAALISGTDQAFIYDTLRKLGREDDVSKVMARNRSFHLLGIGISAPIGSVIGAYFSLNLVMSLIFFPFIIATLISLTLKEPNHDLERKKKEKYFTIVKSGFTELTKNKVLRLLAFEMIITESLVFFLIWTYQIYLEALTVQLIFFGFVSTSMTIIQILFNNVITTLESKINNKRRFLQVYTIIPGIGFILMALIYFIPVSIPLILIVIGFGFTRSLIFVKGMNKQIETENRATVISTINMVASLIRAILYPLVGYFVMWNLNITFILLGASIIIFALLSRIKNEYL